MASYPAKAGILCLNYSNANYWPDTLRLNYVNCIIKGLIVNYRLV